MISITISISNFLNICTFLDPRFKLSHLSSENSDSRLEQEALLLDVETEILVNIWMGHLRVVLASTGNTESRHSHLNHLVKNLESL